MKKDDWIPQQNAPSENEGAGVSSTNRPSSRQFSPAQRDPLHITYHTDDLTFYRTLISATVGGFIQMIDTSVVHQAKSFGFFRSPVQKVYDLILPILINEEVAFRNGCPIPKSHHLFGLNITVNPAAREIIIRATYESGEGFKRPYVIRVLPATDKVLRHMHSVTSGTDKPHPNLEPRL